jgi:hypothetical protein
LFSESLMTPLCESSVSPAGSFFVANDIGCSPLTDSA